MFTRKTWILIIAILVALPLTAMASQQSKKPAAKAPAKGKNPIVELDTTMGVIKVEVFADKAPITARNFIDYVNSGFYNGTVIHRIDDRVIQGGGYTPDLRAKPTQPPIKNESSNGLKNVRGTLAMARFTPPDSATSQFFINLMANPHLDSTPGQPGYAVFAKVVEGMDVVDKIAAVKTAPKSVFPTFPVQAIVIKTAKPVQ